MIEPEYEVLVPGHAEGGLVVLDEPLSFWGGFDAETGRIVDKNHSGMGIEIRGSIVAMPHGRGSSSSSSVLAEALRRGTAPVGFILGEPDPILVIGALVAERLYQTSCPILVGPIPVAGAGRWVIDCEKSPPVAKIG